MRTLLNLRLLVGAGNDAVRSGRIDSASAVAAMAR